MMKGFVIGQTHLGLDIPGFEWSFAPKYRSVLILGGVHGDEVEGVVAGNALATYMRAQFNLRLNLFIIPQFNVDGVLARTRGNSRGVDLNRNLPTSDWSPNVATPRYHPGSSSCSENENKALVSFIDEKKLDFIYSLHSWKPMLNVNGDARGVAEVIAAKTGYIIDEDIGYPTPGSLGSYGLQKKLPVLTYEIERGLDFQKIIDVHVPAICDSLKVLEVPL